MPAFIKTDADEKVWSRAKAQVRKQYPKLSEKDDNFWALTNSIYQTMRKGSEKKSMNKAASGVVARVLAKKAYVPLSPAAQEAMAGQQQPPQGDMPTQDPAMMQQGGQPPMDPAMAQQGMPPMPSQGGEMPTDPSMMDPAMMQQGGQMPMPEQGGQPQPIPVVPGPNGEPLDADTGFIVVDFAQQIEQDPMTGILLNKMSGEFMTPEGQPIPTEQAMQMLEQAAGQMQGQPGGQMPPMDPNMVAQQQAVEGAVPPQQAGMPVPPEETQGEPMMQQTASAEEDMMIAQQQGMMPAGAPPIQGELNEVAGMQVDPNTGMPIDPSTGMLIDVSTGNLIDPATGQPVQQGGVGAAPGMPPQAAPTEDLSQLFEAIPGLQEFISDAPKQLESMDKTLSRVMHDNTALRTDLQGVRRELQKVNDNNDTLLTRLDNMLQIIEQIVAQQAAQGGSVIPPQAIGR